MRSDVQSSERRKAPRKICQPRKSSFSSSPGYSITTSKLSRPRPNREVSLGIRFHRTTATGWLLRRGWRFWNWKPMPAFRTSPGATSQSRAKRSGDAESGVVGSSILDGAESISGAQGEPGLCLKIAVGAHGLHRLEQSKITQRRASVERPDGTIGGRWTL